MSSSDFTESCIGSKGSAMTRSLKLLDIQGSRSPLSSCLFPTLVSMSCESTIAIVDEPSTNFALTSSWVDETFLETSEASFVFFLL